MSGLLRRIRGARAAAPDPAPDDGAAWAGEAPTREQTAGEQPGFDRPTAEAHGGDTARVVADPGGAEPSGAPAIPAGADLDLLVGERPTTQRRSRLRRRLRHLRRVREVLLRDLGGLVFEIHRSGADPASGAQRTLVDQKLRRLATVDGELRELRDVLGEARSVVLREPGIGGTCPECGELHGSDARFCWACGTPVAPGAARPIEAMPRPSDAPQLQTPAATSWAQSGPPAESDSGVAEPVIEGDVVEAHAEPIDPYAGAPPAEETRTEDRRETP